MIRRFVNQRASESDNHKVLRSKWLINQKALGEKSGPVSQEIRKTESQKALK